MARISRRGFLGAGAVAAVGMPAIGWAAAAGVNERIGVGMIGVGRQTVHVNMKQLLGAADAQVVAVCDVDSWRLGNAKKMVEDHYGSVRRSGAYRGCKAYGDWRAVLEDPAVDAVMIATPDHWHAPMTLAAFAAGKDVSCEKPICRSIGEGRAMADAANKHERVFRVDSEFRSLENFHRAAELVRNGRIGKVQRVEVGVPAGDDVDCPPTPPMDVPEGLNYELWQGPAPRRPYTELRVHAPKRYDRPGWMRILLYCDGMITNWGAHLCDVAQWCAGTEETGPVEVEGTGVYPPAGQLWDVLKTFAVKYRFADGTEWAYRTSSPYIRLEGTEGWIVARYPNELEAGPESVLAGELGVDAVRFPFKSDKRDFLDAVHSRGRTLEDAEVGHRTTSLCLLGHIAIQVGGKLRWDPETEKFAGNDAANELAEKGARALPAQ